MPYFLGGGGLGSRAPLDCHDNWWSTGLLCPEFRRYPKMKGVVSKISKIVLRSSVFRKNRFAASLESCGCSTSDFFWGGQLVACLGNNDMQDEKVIYVRL